MHLSSVVLSATALLAQATSGFYLLKATHKDLARYGFAKVNFGPAHADGALFRDDAHPYVSIHLDANGDMGSSFMLRNESIRSVWAEGDNWVLRSRASSSLQETDITGPFSVEADKRFVYKGDGGGVWNACVKRGKWYIFLTKTPSVKTREGWCVGNLTLTATEVV